MPKNKKSPMIVRQQIEIEINEKLPEICMGGWLDPEITYKGNPALRMADGYEQYKGVKIRIIKEWRLGKFDPEIYPPKPNQ